MDLGCHLDGYIAVAAHTCIVPEAAGKEPKEPDAVMANVAVATYQAMLAAAACLTAGKTNADVTAAVEKVAEAYGVTPISSVRMHQMKRFVLDGVKEVALKTPTPEEQEEEKLPPCTFEQHEVYAVDVAMSSGDGNARPGDLRTTVFKRNVGQQYHLKLQASRALLTEVDRRFSTFPFTLRHMKDVRKARLGISECVTHGLLTPYPSLHDHSGVVAHFKCTVLLLPSRTSRVTGLTLPTYFKSDKKLDPASAQLVQKMSGGIGSKKKKNKKKKAAGAGAAAAADADKEDGEEEKE
jgi:curved DNA binding protein